jgi:RNA polymerase sigma-70 factor (ECF subfamily)
MAESSLVDAPPETQDPIDVRTDPELIAAINGGDAAAFEVLYQRYRDWVVHLAARLTGDEHLALDVLQETFLYVLKKFPGFRLTAQFKSFLYPAVRNLSIAARRKTKRLQSDETELQAIADTAAQSQPTAAADLAFVLDGLPEEQREVLLLRFVDGFSLAEIAGALGIPLGTVKSRLHNALAALKQDPRTREFFEH